MKILALVGSLRADSLNHQLVREALAMAPADAEVEVWQRLDELPFYNQDHEDQPPAAVLELREAIRAADVLVVATPEYNGSVSGVLKNAIDWASRPYGESALRERPALVLAASPSPRGAQWAREDLARILGVAGAVVVAESVGLPDAFSTLEGGALRHEPTRERLAALMAELTGAAPATAA